MADKKRKDKKTAKDSVREDLRADRDDALGYSREQFTFEEEAPKGTSKKKPKKSGK